MDAANIRRIVNFYFELKNKDVKFKDVEPCFVEGNDNLAILG